jgi:hypothetical protein
MSFIKVSAYSLERRIGAGIRNVIEYSKGVIRKSARMLHL